MIGMPSQHLYWMGVDIAILKNNKDLEDTIYIGLLTVCFNFQSYRDISYECFFNTTSQLSHATSQFSHIILGTARTAQG